MLALKKPVDQTTEYFLDLHIDFMCFIACVCCGANKDLLRFPEVTTKFQLVENPANLFGHDLQPVYMEGTLQGPITEFYTTFVINNLLLVNQVFRLKVETRILSNLISRSITVLLAYQQLIFIERDVIQIFVHSFYMPTLDDCLALASQLSGPELFMLSTASEYLVIETLRFLLAANSHEYIKEILHFLISGAATKASLPNKNGILFTISSISEVYSEVALDLSYKDRDAIVECACQLLTETQERISDWMNRYFEGIEGDKATEVAPLFSCYERVAHLTSKILMKSYLYLTENVQLCNSAIDRDFENHQRKSGPLF